MGGSSQTQNVQRGVIMIFFFNFALLTIFVIMRFCKKQIDVPNGEGSSEAGKKYEEKQKENPSQNYKESQEHISNDFDRAAVKRSELKQDATCLEKWLHGVQQFVYYYCPYLILLPLNILTGTSKAFSLTLFFIIGLCIMLFNGAKLHRKLGDSKCLNVVLENLWLLLCFFYCVNQWGGSPVSMPYIVR